MEVSLEEAKNVGSTNAVILALLREDPSRVAKDLVTCLDLATTSIHNGIRQLEQAGYLTVDRSASPYKLTVATTPEKPTRVKFTWKSEETMRSGRRTKRVEHYAGQ